MDQHTQMSFYRKRPSGLRAGEIEALNKKIANGLIWQADGKPIGTTLTEGLISVKGDYIFPIIRGIILLLKDLALVDSKENVLKDTISADKANW